MYALVDCNNFYVSCERVFQPKYQHTPVVVLSNNDGCVISRSDEAKALGIPMGAPEFKCRAIVEQHQIKVFSSNYALYGDMSKRVMNVLAQFTPNIENYSIDEAFLNFSNTTITDFESCGSTIKQRIQKWLGIPVCVGFGNSKALSKIANRIAKKFKDRTQGVYVIDTEEKRIKALKWTKIEDVWGIGGRLSKKMHARNIKTAFDFTLPQHEDYIKNIMGVVGKRLREELLGNSVLALEEAAIAKKNIAVTRTFEKTITSKQMLEERIATFASVASEKLRHQKSCCYGITLYLKKDKYKMEGGGQYNYALYEKLPFATQSAITLAQSALKMLHKIYDETALYRKAGIILSDIIPQGKKQYNLFVEENPKHEKIMKVMDMMQQKTGERKIKIANQDLERTWKMKQNHLSKRWTTNLKEIIEIKCL